MSEQEEPSRATDAGAGLRAAADFAAHVGRRFQRDLCTMAAAQLTFTVVLAIVPLAAVFLWLLASDPSFDQIRVDMVLFFTANFVPAAGMEFASFFQEFTETAANLGLVGMLGLAVTAVLTLNTVQTAFNRIWGASAARPLIFRVPIYWTVLSLGGVLIAIGISVGARLLAETDSALAGETLDEVNRILPLADILRRVAVLFATTAGFTLFYWILPNARIDWRHALAGGLLAAILVEVLKRGFTLYVTLFPTYEAIYGALAAIPLFLVWLYLLWIVTLLGAEVVAALPEWLAKRRRSDEEGTRLDHLRLAAAVLANLSVASRRGGGLSGSDLAAGADHPELLDPVLSALRAARFVELDQDQDWVLIRDLSETPVHALFEAMGFTLGEGVDDAGAPRDLGWQTRLEGLLSAIDSEDRRRLSDPLKGLLVGR